MKKPYLLAIEPPNQVGHCHRPLDPNKENQMGFCNKDNMGTTQKKSN
jgi:hypothetical protein